MDHLDEQSKQQIRREGQSFLNSMFWAKLKQYLERKANGYDLDCKRTSPAGPEAMAKIAGAQEGLRFYGDLLTNIETLVKRGATRF